MSSSGAICSQLATQERASLDPWPSIAPCRPLRRWKLGDRDQRSSTVRNGRGDNLGEAVTQLRAQVFRYPSAKGRVTNLRQCDHAGLSEACGIGSTEKHMYNTRLAGAFRNPRVGERKQHEGRELPVESRRHPSTVHPGSMPQVPGMGRTAGRNRNRRVSRVEMSRKWWATLKITQN